MGVCLSCWFNSPVLGCCGNGVIWFSLTHLQIHVFIPGVPTGFVPPGVANCTQTLVNGNCW